MNDKAIVIFTLLTTIGLALPARAQLQNPSQDFFEEGWEQLEREIEILREKPLEEEANQSVESAPLLEVKPSPSSEFRPLDEEEIPIETPDKIDNLNNGL